jgi:hypothetical protein
MAKSTNALLTGRIQKRKTNTLHRSHPACNTRPVHTVGSISDIPASPADVGFAPDTGLKTDMAGRQFSAIS